MNAADPVPLGHTGLTVSALGLGTAPLGNLFQPVSERDARATVTRALALGLRLFDTAPLYGTGLAEQRLGAALAGTPRDRYVLASKVGRVIVPSAAGTVGQEGAHYVDTGPGTFVWDFSAEGVQRSLSASLERLGLDRIDLVHIHDPDEHMDQAIGDTFPALARLREQGVIRAIGVGTNEAWIGARFARETDTDCVLIAGRYTLLDQSALDELFPLCRARGIAVIAAGIYNSGILANPVPGATYRYEPASVEMLTRAQRLSAVCAEHGTSLRAAALHFPALHPAVASVLVGARREEEIEENCRLFGETVPAALWSDLKERGLLPPNAPTGA